MAKAEKVRQRAQSDEVKRMVSVQIIEDVKGQV
jgi:hypothetical protein